MVRVCPCCGSRTFVPRYSPWQILEEIDLRARFVARRFDHKPHKTELKDLTEFLHGGPGRLLACARCGLIVRDEDSTSRYDDDFYDLNLLDHLYPRYVGAFRAKERDYRDLLPPRAEVVELGSHVGAFLEIAERWGWRAIGLDIGRYTSEFAKSKGLTVRREAIEDCTLAGHRTDALFIWNCFEQIADPRSTLASAHRLLKRHGLLIVRVPNVSFYERQRAHLRASAAALRGLAYNNLLGFPYLFGYSPSTLRRLLIRNGFQPVAVHNSSLLTLPFPDVPARVERESKALYSVTARAEALSGPWVEMVCREMVCRETVCRDRGV